MPLMFVSETLVASLGFIIFLFFGLRKEIFLFWMEIFKGNWTRMTDAGLNASFGANKSEVRKTTTTNHPETNELVKI